MPFIGGMSFTLSCVQSAISLSLFVNCIFLLTWLLSNVQDALDGPGYPMFSGLCYYAHNVSCVPSQPVIADTNPKTHQIHHLAMALQWACQYALLPCFEFHLSDSDWIEMGNFLQLVTRRATFPNLFVYLNICHFEYLPHLIITPACFDHATLHSRSFA